MKYLAENFQSPGKAELVNGFFPDQCGMWGRGITKMNKSQFELLTQQSYTMQPRQWGTSYSLGEPGGGDASWG